MSAAIIPFRPRGAPALRSGSLDEALRRLGDTMAEQRREKNLLDWTRRSRERFIAAYGARPALACHRAVLADLDARIAALEGRS